jgi:hypothetical protein
MTEVKMRNPIGWTLRAFAVLLLSAAVPAAPAASAAAPTRSALPAVSFADDAPNAKCCFTNPGYTGTCEVQPAKDESCGQILDYLNNPMAQGKSYCGNTTVRSGWKQASCENK